MVDESPEAQSAFGGSDGNAVFCQRVGSCRGGRFTCAFRGPNNTSWKVLTWQCALL